MGTLTGPADPGGLDIGEALRRILRVHWLLVGILAALGLAAGYGLHVRDRPLYAASARVALDTPDPQGTSDSEAYADAARAIVTSPSHVAAALAAIHVSRDPVATAAGEVALDPLGTSGVEKITVTDPDPAVAPALANALAADLVQTRIQLRSGHQTTPIARQLQDVEARTGQLDAQITGVQTSLQQAAPADVPRLSSLMTNLISERASLVQEENVLLAQRTPLLIDRASGATRAGRGRLEDMGLSLLVGLSLGVGAATVLEVLRPTLAGPRSVARAAGAPLLGELSPRREVLDPLLRQRFRRAAREAGTVGLVSLGRAADLEALAAGLHANGHAPSANGHTADPEPAVRALGRLDAAWAVTAPAPAGLVLIVPSIVKRAEIERARELAELSGAPLIGVLTYRPGRRVR